jgi:hypothetical protein
MNRPLYSRIFHVAFYSDEEILNETMAAYSYTVPLNQEAILCGLIAASLLAILVESILIGILGLGRLTIGEAASARA